MKTPSIIALAMIFVACSPKIVTPMQADIDRVAAKHPTYTLANVQQGKVLYEQQCTACHGLKKPTAYSEAAWQKIVPNMVIKANKKAGKQAISPAQQALILEYLLTMTQK